MASIKPVRKAVFPVAGMGTRFLPATKAVPKEMLPVVDKPVIQYAVEEAREAGIEQFVFITGRGEMGLDDQVVPVGPGSMVRVGPDVMRTWRCLPDSPEPLTWLCIRGGGSATLEEIGDHGNRFDGHPTPW